MMSVFDKQEIQEEYVVTESFNFQSWKKFGISSIIEPRHAISNNVACATSKG